MVFLCFLKTIRHDFIKRRTLFLLVFTCFGLPVHGADLTVYYAGVSYLGDEQYITDNYPVATSLNTKSEHHAQAPLSKRFLALLQQSQSLPFTLSIYKEDNHKTGPAIAMTLAIERENVSIETFENYKKVVAEVSAQVLFFDFQTNQLVTSIPVDIARNDVVPLHTTNQQAELVNTQALYMPEKSNQESILSLAVNYIEQAALPRDGVIRFKVADVSIGEEALGFVPKHINTEALTQIFGQYFTAQLAHLSHLNMIPYTKGYAIGNKMVGRMGNGEVYNLTLPEADYVFTVTVSNFKHIAQPHKHLFASRVLMSAKELTDSTPIINDYLHTAVAKLVGDNQTDIDEWAAYEDALETLLSDIARQLAVPEKAWFNNHSKNTRRTYNTFKQWSEDINGL